MYREKFKNAQQKIIELLEENEQLRKLYEEGKLLKKDFPT